MLPSLFDGIYIGKLLLEASHWRFVDTMWHFE